MMYFSKEELELLLGCIRAAWMESLIGDDECSQMERKLEKKLEEME